MAVNSTSASHRLLVQWATGLACFTLAAVVFTGQVWIDFNYAGQRLTWGRAFAAALVEWLPWAVLTPGVVWLARRWPFTAKRWLVPLAAHLLLAFVVAFLKLLIEAMLVRQVPLPMPRLVSSLRMYITLLTYWAIVVATQFIDYARAARARDLQASRLQTELARAQVEALKMQLHPHFLFNTLNTIAGLMREDIEAADLMIAHLAELLRRTFESEGVQEVALDRELQVLETYLAIQQVRLGDRLQITLAASDEARRMLVPNLILQPLVENAIRHGVAARPGPGRVALDARVSETELVIIVTNDGPPLETPFHAGCGVRNTRSRLAALYGAHGRFTLVRSPAGGAVATLTLPAQLPQTS